MDLGKLSAQQYAHGVSMLLISMFLFGCSPISPDGGQAPAPITQTIEIRGETPGAVTAAAERTRDTLVPSTPESGSKPTAPIISDPVLTPASTQVAREIAAEYEICSPLAGIPVDELADIVSAPYDPPPLGKEDRHHGLDFAFYRRGDYASILGVGVQAAMDSKVVMLLEDSFPYGNAIMFETVGTALPEEIRNTLCMGEEESLYILYAHLSDPPTAALLENLTACEQVGFVGKSGNAGVPHLHMETRIGPSGEIFYGMSYYSTQTTPNERANYIRWRTSGDFIHFDPFLLYKLHASSLLSGNADEEY